jgi:hypothetical protein
LLSNALQDRASPPMDAAAELRNIFTALLKKAISDQSLARD